MSAIIQDLRYAFRQLLKSPGFTVVALLTLTLCIAANVVIFAVTDAILVRSLPFPEAHRLVIVQHSYPGAGIERDQCSLPNYYDWRKAITAFANVAASRSTNAVIGDETSAERIHSECVTPDFLGTLGVKPALGRFFTEEETDHGQDAVVVLTDAYWRSHYNADPNILGHDIRVDGRTCRIIGILRPDFRYLSSPARLFLPLASGPEDRGPNRRHNLDVQIIARLAPGATLATAQAQIDALNARQMEDDSLGGQLKGSGFRVFVSGLHADHVRGVRSTILLLQASAFFLLLIGGVNLLNLLLVHANGRIREFGVRQALGASGRHIAGAVVIETVLLAGIGGTLGVALGGAGIALLSIFGIENLPLGAEISLNYRVAGTALCSSILMGCAFSLPIIGFHMRHRLALTLQASSRGVTTNRAFQQLRQTFIMAQIALAFMLLTGAGLLGVSLLHVLRISPGFQPEHVLTARIGLPVDHYRDGKARLAFIQRFLEEMRTQVGVTSVAVSNVVPFTGQDNSSVITVEGIEPRPGDSIRVHFKSETMGDFWQALGIPLRRGRLLKTSDNFSDQRVCVVDDGFARQYWPKGDAVGHRIAKSTVFNEQDSFTVVGIVGQVKQDKLVETPLGTVYFPYRDATQGDVYVVARSPLGSASMVSSLRQTIRHLDPGIPMDDVRMMQDRIDASLIQRRSPALLASLFAVIALLLTMIGTYGVVAHAVAQSRHEIGIRMALGASPGQIGRRFLSLGFRLLLPGAAVGIFGAWLVGRGMQSILFDVPAFHIETLILASIVLVVVSLVSCLIPAMRASHVDPLIALKSE